MAALDCSRCGGSLASGQRYCFRCGERAPPPPLEWRRPLAAAAIVALVAALIFAVFYLKAGTSASDDVERATDQAANPGKLAASLATWGAAGAGSSGAGATGSASARTVASADSASAPTS